MLRNVGSLFAAIFLYTLAWAQSPASLQYLDRAIIQHKGSSVAVVANDPRPLLQALFAIREEYGWRVNWEEAPGYSHFDAVDSTDPKWRANHPGEKGVTRPAGGRFVGAFPEVEGAPDAGVEKSLLAKLVQDYNATENPGKYVLRADPDGQMTIVGTKVRDETGALQEVAPLLDTLVTLASESRSLYDTVSAILDALRNSAGKKVIMMSIPNNEFRSTQLTLGGHDVPARQLLNQALASTRRPLQYDLGFDPDNSPTYVLNVSVAARAEGDEAGGRRLVPIDRHH
jgi:hypothetical protein